MIEFDIISTMIVLPLIGALCIALFIRGDDERARDNAKNAALWITVGSFFFSLIIAYSFDVEQSGYQFFREYAWIEGTDIAYRVGLDGISLCFVLLTTFLMPICILASWTSINHRVKEYMIAFLVLEALTIGVFCALDFLVFYIFFEAVLIPMFLIIGIWGGENRVYASIKFFLYTLAGSILLLLAMLYLYFTFDTTNIMTLSAKAPGLALDIQKWLWLAFFASFAVKVPMWPFHTWLPDAHVQAPTAGSVILAGILLKLGGYGFVRFALPMLPDASAYFAPLVFFLSAVAVIYTSLVALMQKDMKKLIAYSSVAHMGFVTLGLFALNKQGIEGSIVVMISHGLVSGALFLGVGILYDRLHTKEIAKYGGVVDVMPKFAALYMLFTMASIGLPGTSGFVGELLTLAGIYKVSKVLTAFAGTGLILGAAYMLWLYARVFFGEASSKDVKNMPELSKHEMIALVPIAVLVILFGVYPSLITDVISLPVDQIVEHLGK